MKVVDFYYMGRIPIDHLSDHLIKIRILIVQSAKQFGFFSVVVRFRPIGRGLAVAQPTAMIISDPGSQFPPRWTLN